MRKGKEKLKCPLCEFTKVEYLDHGVRIGEYGTEIPYAAYECHGCGAYFEVPYEVPYGYGTRRAKR